MHASKMNTDVYELVNTEIFPKLCEQRRPGSNGTSIAMSISWSQILVSKSHLPIKETLEAVVYFRSRAGKSGR